MRIIDDETYAQIVAILAQDPKVAVFQKLLLSQKKNENYLAGSYTAPKVPVMNSICVGRSVRSMDI